MLEAEQGFIDSVEDITKTIEDMIKIVTGQLLNSSIADIENAGNRKVDFFSWLDKPFITITYREAVEILLANVQKLKSPVNSKEGLSKEQELFLVDHLKCPVFLVEWPADMKPFYMRQCQNNTGNVIILLKLFELFFLNICVSGRSVRFSCARYW